MAHTVVLGPLYPEMEEATIGRWLVTAGDTVEAGQPLAELITEKVVYELQSPAAGEVLMLLSAEKSVVSLGAALAVIGVAGEAVTELAALQAENRRLATERDAALSLLHQATGQATPSVPSSSGSAVRATPAARRLARERGVDLSTLQGSGPGGMISVDDIP